MKSEDYKKKLLELYYEHARKEGLKFEESDLEVTYTNEFELNTFNDLLKRGKQSRSTKGFKLEGIVKLEEDSIPKVPEYSVALGLSDQGGRGKKELFVADRMGFYRLDFSDGTSLFMVKWMVGEGKDRCVDGLYVSTKETWVNIFKILQEEKKRQSRPKKGIFRIRSTGGELTYERVKKVNETPVVHPSTEALNKDIEFFYSNVELFTRRNQPGTRKVLLVGPPGTGKTSISMRLSSKYKGEKCVVFATDLSAVALHLAKCAKYNISTLVILEDAESSLRDANSSVLNFLDGIDQPINKNGAYVIMTTNHPDEIESRTVRPGRVAKRIAFGALKGMDALACADIYFDGILWNDKTSEKDKKAIQKELFDVVHNNDKGMTGAEIKTLSEATIAYAVSELIPTITVETVATVKEQMHAELTNLMKMAEEEGLSRSGRGGSPFFEPAYKKKQSKKDFTFDPNQQKEKF